MLADRGTDLQMPEEEMANGDSVLQSPLHQEQRQFRKVVWLILQYLTGMLAAEQNERGTPHTCTS